MGFFATHGRKLAFVGLAFFALLSLAMDWGWGDFYPRLAKYGRIAPYAFLASAGVGLLLLLDFVLHEKKKFFANYKRALFYALLIGLGLVLRFIFFPFESGDWTMAIADWYAYLKSNGGFSALANEDLADYNVFYLYFLAALTYLPLPGLWALKGLGVCFELGGALLGAKITRQLGAGKWGQRAAFLGIWFHPIVLLNGAVWGQSDMYYTFFLLLSFYFLLLLFRPNKNENASLFGYALPPTAGFVVAFGLAFSFKLQAVFFVFPLVLAYASGRVKWQAVFWFLGTYLLVCLPAVWAGRPLLSVLMIYADQALDYPRLTLNAPNVYQFLPKAPFAPFMRAGIFVSFSLVLSFFFVAYFYAERFLKHKSTLLYVALLSLMVMPFFLPKMHERYFFAADVFSVILAATATQRAWLPVLIGAASLAGYTPFLFQSDVLDLRAAALCNLAVICVLLHDLFYQLRTKKWPVAKKT